MEIKNYLEKLTAELKELEVELKNLGVQNPTTPEDWIPTPSEKSDAEPDPIDLGDRSEDWQERRGTLDQLETRFNNLKLAIEKINSGSYGKCEICQSDIEADRLEVNPAARTCKTHIDDESSLMQN